MLKCNLCEDSHIFTSQTTAERHVLEQHTSFGWRCCYCKFVSARQDGIHRCSRGDKPPMALCYNRLTGVKGEEALREYERFKEFELKKRLSKVNGEASRSETCVERERSRSRVEKERTRSRSRVEKKRSRSKSRTEKERSKGSVEKEMLKSRLEKERSKSKDSVEKERSKSKDSVEEERSKSKDSVEKESPRTRAERSKSSSRSWSPWRKREDQTKPDQRRSLGPSKIRKDYRIPKVGPTRYHPADILSLGSGNDNVTANEGSGKHEVYTPLPAEESCKAYASYCRERVRHTDAVRRITMERYHAMAKGKVTVNVGGARFMTSLPTLRADPDNLFAILTDTDLGYKEGNEVFIDRDSTHFVHVLNFLRNKCEIDPETLPKDRKSLAQLLREVKEYRLQGLIEAVQSRIDVIATF